MSRYLQAEQAARANRKAMQGTAACLGGGGAALGCLHSMHAADQCAHWVKFDLLNLRTFADKWQHLARDVPTYDTCSTWPIRIWLSNASFYVLHTFVSDGAAV